MLSPFELRYAIFHTAKDVLEAQYKANLATWEVLNKTTRDAVDLAPKFPTVAEIIEKAIDMNKFVSSANEKELVNVARKLTGY